MRDRDNSYGDEVRLRISSMGIEELLTPPRSPWQNLYVERLIGSIRRDCLNHFVTLNAKHPKRTLASYFGYYHGFRTAFGARQAMGRSAGSLQSPSSAVFITVTNALQRNDMVADAILANECVQQRLAC